MRKTKTFTTLECVARDVRRAKTVADAVEFLSACVGRVIVNTSAQTHAENRRLRGEVRRYRRVIHTPAGLGDFATCRYCGAGVRMPCDSRRIKHFPGCIAEAALAPRRRKK